MLDALGPAKMNRDAHSAKLAARLASRALEARREALGEAAAVAYVAVGLGLAAEEVAKSIRGLAASEVPRGAEVESK